MLLAIRQREEGTIVGPSLGLVKCPILVCAQLSGPQTLGPRSSGLMDWEALGLCLLQLSALCHQSNSASLT